MKVIFVSSSDLYGEGFNGGKRVSKRNLNLIQDFYGKENVHIVNISRRSLTLDETLEKRVYSISSTKNKLHTLISNLLLYSGYLSFLSSKRLLKLLKIEKPEVIFFDTSNYGRIIKSIKKTLIGVKVITFFHNCEYDYAKSKVVVQGVKYYPMVYSNKYNENLSVKHSDKLIFLNKRDQTRVLTTYGNKESIIIPVTFEDEMKKKKSSFKEISSGPLKLLFVGSYFHANIDAIKWFCNEVLPNINSTLKIIGRGMEVLRKDFNMPNLIIEGSVDSLEEYYREADVLISPIRLGAGMKVKTAEALMYGKTIIGTKESFEGYDIEDGKEAFICNTSEDFINRILDLEKNGTNKFNKYSREIFKKKYSNEAAIKIFFEKIGEVFNENNIL